MSLTNLNCTMSFLPCNSLNHVHGVAQYTPRGSIIPNGVPSPSHPYEIKWSKINLIGITINRVLHSCPSNTKLQNYTSTSHRVKRKKKTKKEIKIKESIFGYQFVEIQKARAFLFNSLHRSQNSFSPNPNFLKSET